MQIFESFRETRKQIFVVEYKTTIAIVNGIPQLKFDFDFFTNKRDALNKKKSKEKDVKISVYELKPNFFNWYEVLPRIVNNKQIYMLSGVLNKTNPSTNKKVEIYIGVDKEIAKILKSKL